MFNRVEVIGGVIAVASMVLALVLVQERASLANLAVSGTQIATVDSGLSVATEEQSTASNQVQEETQNMVINDVKVGEGPEVKEGDTVSVHYVGSLESGQEFDSSKKRGTPFEFTVGARQVIVGWEQGLVGMKVGGERVLIIPPELGYGDRGIGPIPGGATLSFTIELLEIK